MALVGKGKSTLGGVDPRLDIMALVGIGKITLGVVDPNLDMEATYIMVLVGIGKKNLGWHRPPNCRQALLMKAINLLNTESDISNQ